MLAACLGKDDLSFSICVGGLAGPVTQAEKVALAFSSLHGAVGVVLAWSGHVGSTALAGGGIASDSSTALVPSHTVSSLGNGEHGDADVSEAAHSAELAVITTCAGSSSGVSGNAGGIVMAEESALAVSCLLACLSGLSSNTDAVGAVGEHSSAVCGCGALVIGKSEARCLGAHVALVAGNGL